MRGFKERERAFEARFARENEASFMLSMKACSLLARDIAENKLGLDKRATDRYCEKILSFSVKNCNMETLYTYIAKKLQKHNVALTHQELDALYAKALGRARIEML